jgi:hypothetical protein
MARDLGRTQLQMMDSRGGLFRACATGSYEVQVLGSSAAATEPVPNTDEIMTLGVRALKQLIERAGLSHAGCAEKSDLRNKALQAHGHLLLCSSTTAAAASGAGRLRWLPLSVPVTQLPPRSVLRLRWRDPRVASPASEAAYRNERLEGAAGTLTFAYYDPASLAMELHIVASRRDCNEHRLLDGGVQYMAGEEHYFGSALLHFALAGSVAPPLPQPRASSEAPRVWDDTVAHREMAMFVAKMQRDAPALPRGSTVEPGANGGHSKLDPRRNQAFVLTMQLKEQAFKEFPWHAQEDGTGASLPTEDDQLPSWWRLAIGPWDAAFKRMFEGGGEPPSLPCMFYGSRADPQGCGCRVTRCPYVHDASWLEWDRDMRQHPRICCGCGGYGEQRCTACVKVFFCGGCPKTLGLTRCAACARANRPARKAAPPQQAGSDSRVGTSQPEPGSMAEDHSMQAVHTRASCAMCGKVEGKLLKCARCKNTTYCSIACQRQGWPAHKARCKKLKGERREVKADQKKGGEVVKAMSDATGCGGVAVMQMPAPGKTQVMMYEWGKEADMEKYEFAELGELPVPLQLLLSCGPLKNITHAKGVLDAHPTLPVAELRLPGAGFTALDWAARKGNHEIAEWLATGARTSALLRTGAPVGWACYTNHVDLARMLVRHGCDAARTDATFFGGKPPVINTAENGQLLALKFLVEEQGQDVRTQMASGSGILAAIERARRDGHLPPGHVACARWAREKGAVC